MMSPGSPECYGGPTYLFIVKLSFPADPVIVPEQNDVLAQLPVMVPVQRLPPYVPVSPPELLICPVMLRAGPPVPKFPLLSTS